MAAQTASGNGSQGCRGQKAGSWQDIVQGARPPSLQDQGRSGGCSKLRTILEEDVRNHRAEERRSIWLLNL